MPLVRVRHNAGMYESMLAEMGGLIAHLVATNLSVEEEDGHLKESDIEVIFDEKKPYDRVKHDLLVDIEAYHYPSRHGNRQERVEQILAGIKSAYGGSVGVWLKIEAGAAWAESPATG